MSRAEIIAKALSPYLPEGTSGIIAEWIVEHGVKFVVAKPRATKLGDFRAGNKRMASRISVNGDLNPYAFLITTVHEFAHLECHLEHGWGVKPHGAEWKRVYTSMLLPFMEMSVFPSEIHEALTHHIASPSASSCSCPVLHKALSLFDDGQTTFLAEMTQGSIFAFREEAYSVLEKKRTRYLCKRLSDGKKYLISGRATISPLDAAAS